MVSFTAWKVYGNLDACANSVNQCLFLPSKKKGPGHEATTYLLQDHHV